VVCGTQAAALPAYQPLFPQPVPLLHSACDTDIIHPLTSSSKHLSQGSPLSFSTHRCHSERDHFDSRHLSPASQRRSADGTLRREESSDSGGVFLTPSSDHTELKLDLQSTSVCRNGSSSSTDFPPTCLVDVDRMLAMPSENSYLEYHRKDFVTQNSSAGNVRTVVEPFVPEQSASVLPDSVHFRSNSCYGVLHHRADEEFVTPSKTKKKTKKPRHNSQPGQAGCTSARSMAVYGGNPKWIWKS